MTRFARAKGSKSSNEKTPENSTPWEVMKEQLMQAKKDVEESKKREQAEQQRIENYENFLKEHKTQKRKATWCDFPDSQISILSKSNQATEPVKKKNKKQSNASEQSQLTQSQTIQNEGSYPEKSMKKSKKNKYNNNNTMELTTDSEVQPADDKEIVQHNESKKGKKNKKQNLNMSGKDSTEQENEVKDTGHPEKKIKKHKVSKVGKTHTDNQQNSDSKGNASKKNNHTKQKKRLANGPPSRRKPVNDNSFQLIINGKEIELVRFDGFPIMKKDAERLQELKTSMIKKGIPKSEVQRTMKLERRRAEKALARIKRDVCYNCRKGGHNLSDCPELKTKIPGVGAPDGLCFKCGSTEHRQFECKVQRDKEFRFATCFICKEPGHIARQCPDNPKGLYPNGGSCKLCGDVTHLRKDCPTVQDKREDSSIKLHTLDSSELEAIPLKTKTTGMEEQVSKKPKKITF